MDAARTVSFGGRLSSSSHLNDDDLYSRRSQQPYDAPLSASFPPGRRIGGGGRRRKRNHRSDAAAFVKPKRSYPLLLNSYDLFQNIQRRLSRRIDKRRTRSVVQLRRTPRNSVDGDNEEAFERQKMAEGEEEEELSPSFRTGYDTSPVTFFDLMLFFVCAVGVSVAWTSILSGLSYFSKKYGKASFLWLNLATYVPSLPVALAQTVWDDGYVRFVSRAHTTTTILHATNDVAAQVR